jgi:hypothetical protein
MSEEPLEYEAQEPLPYIPSASFQQDAPVSPLAQPAEHAILISPEPSLPVVSMHIQKKSRRGLWIAMSVIALLLVSISSFFTIRYINRSTPDKTLATFCSALQQQNYQSAYSQFSQKLQKTFSESTFASNFSQDIVTACTYTPTRSNGNRVSTNMKIAHDYAGTNNDVIILIANSDQVWKIDDFYRL